MSRTITMSLFNPAPWNAMGLDAALDQCIDGAETRNEWPSEHGDSEGEMFATLENYHAPDGVTYHVLFWTNWCNSWSPWTSDSTHATLYRTDDAADMEEFAADVAEWEAMPELDPCYSPEEEGDGPTFSVIEYSSFFAVRHNPTGEEHPMGDGVDTLFYADGSAMLPGSPGFVQAWEDSLNSDEGETMEAYFPDLAE